MSHIAEVNLVHNVENIIGTVDVDIVGGSVTVGTISTVNTVDVVTDVTTLDTITNPVDTNVLGGTIDTITNPVDVNVLSGTVTVGSIGTVGTITNPVSLQGTTDGGGNLDIPVDEFGHLEVAIHRPLLPFGSLHTESITPIFQVDAVYGINNGLVSTTVSGSGVITAPNSSFECSTGVTIFSQAVLQSKKRLRYRPGQGVIGRFTAIYTSPVALSYQIVGFGHAEDGVYIGYVGTDFGILYSSRGVRETRTLTITTGSSSVQNATVTLNGVNYTVPLTNHGGNTTRCAYEIAVGNYSGTWQTYAQGNTVVFVSGSAGLKNGAYSVTAAAVVSSFAQTKAGVASTDVFISQATFNIDTLDGNGPSGLVLDPMFGNVYQINIQYLGFGGITFEIENASTANNPTFVTFHVIRLPNTLTQTSFGNPAFPFTIAAYSAGSTTDLIVQSASFAGFIEGAKILHGNRFTYFN